MPSTGAAKARQNKKRNSIRDARCAVARAMKRIAEHERRLRAAQAVLATVVAPSCAGAASPQSGWGPVVAHDVANHHHPMMPFTSSTGFAPWSATPDPQMMLEQQNLLLLAAEHMHESAAPPLDAAPLGSGAWPHFGWQTDLDSWGARASASDSALAEETQAKRGGTPQCVLNPSAIENALDVCGASGMLRPIQPMPHYSAVSDIFSEATSQGSGSHRSTSSASIIDASDGDSRHEGELERSPGALRVHVARAARAGDEGDSGRSYPTLLLHDATHY